MNRGVIIAVVFIFLLIACAPQKPVVEVNQKAYSSGEVAVKEEVKQEEKQETKEAAQQEEEKEEEPEFTEGKVVSNVTSETSSLTDMGAVFASGEKHVCTYKLQDPESKRISAVEIWLESSGQFRTRSEISGTESYIISSIFDGSVYYYWDSRIEKGNKYTESEAKSKNLPVKDTIISGATDVKCRKVSSIPSILLKVPSNIKIQ